MKTIPSPKRIRTVFLDTNGTDEEMYFCPRCRIPVLEYVGNIMQEVPGHPPYTPYTILKCKGSVKRKDGDWEECNSYYCFVTAVYTRNPSM